MAEEIRSSKVKVVPVRLGKGGMVTEAVELEKTDSKHAVLSMQDNTGMPVLGLPKAGRGLTLKELV